MARVTVIRYGESATLKDEGEQLVRHVWIFGYFDSGHALMLDVYAEERRKSRRHKYRKIRSYGRLKWLVEGEAVPIDLTRVPTDYGVLLEARETFARTLDVRLAPMP